MRWHCEATSGRAVHEKATSRSSTNSAHRGGVIRGDTQLFRYFSDNESFIRWLSDLIFAAIPQSLGCCTYPVVSVRKTAFGQRLLPEVGVRLTLCARSNPMTASCPARHGGEPWRAACARARASP
jgi:hypothetical protein